VSGEYFEVPLVNDGDNSWELGTNMAWDKLTLGIRNMPAKLRMKGNTLQRMMTKAKGERDKMFLIYLKLSNRHNASRAGHSPDSSVFVGPCKDIALSSVSHGDLIIFNDFATGQEDSQGKTPRKL
jgi:hypothetical protein